MAHEQKPDFVFRRNGRVHLNRRGASVQSTAGSRGVRISGSNAGYTTFRGSVKSTGHLLHSPVSPSLPLPCVVCHQVSNPLYILWTYWHAAVQFCKTFKIQRISKYKARHHAPIYPVYIKLENCLHFVSEFWTFSNLMFPTRRQMLLNSVIINNKPTKLCMSFFVGLFHNAVINDE